MTSNDILTNLVLLGLAAAIWFGRAYLVRRRRAKSGRAVTVSKAEQLTTTAGEKRTQALYKHADGIEQFVDKSAHPRELIGQADFKAAVAILNGADMSADEVRQYATGANWQLACAALYVLTECPERDQMAQSVLAQLGQMRPWTIYFALLYFTSLNDRPAVGAPIALAQLWWRDNAILLDIFREYFDRRQKLEDMVTFGGALDLPSRADPTHIDWVLYRIEHVSADVLRAELSQWQQAHINRPFLASVGRFWTQAAEDDLLVVPDEWSDRLAEAQGRASASPRSCHWWQAGSRRRVGRSSRRPRPS